MFYPREIRTGDLIEFNGAPECDGILTNMIAIDGEEWEVCEEQDQKWIKAIVIHQLIDGKFAVWQTGGLPGAFVITHKARYLN